MRCSKCGAENPEKARFCTECAAPFARRCPSCNAENPSTAKFCLECATPLSTAAQPSKGVLPDSGGIRVKDSHSTPGEVDGERKTVTALFADIKGSTEVMRDIDPEEARAIVDPVLHLMMEAVHRYGGYVAQSTGDGIFALFGAPIAHEDHPQRALHAALAMQEELRRRADRLRTDGKIPVEARVGVNTGEVVLRTLQTGGHTEYTPIGHTGNLAARMQTVAPAGSIAASEATRRLCEGYFTFRDLGRTEVKGLTEPINVYEVVGAGPLRSHFELAAQRGLTAFAGRDAELAQMRRAFELARSGHGQLLAVVAEAGTGKSRLFHEFKASLPAQCKLLEAHSVSHGKASAWLPVLELLRGYFAIQVTDDPTTRREKIRAVLAALDPALDDTLPYLFGLLGIQETPDPLVQMNPQVRRRRTLEAIKRIILRESLQHPLVMIFEDLHWIDAETQALLDLLADAGAAARLLLLVNYRPEYRHEWSARGHYLQLRLDPLGGKNAAAMMAALLGEAAEVEALKRVIAERAGGNPFFIEEMVQALLDQGVLVRNGRVKVVRSLSQLRLPPTVQGVLASRIDRLPAEQKELLQNLAVMGRESPLGLIRKVFDRAEAQLERMLADLRAAEFIYEQPALTDAEYIFKHALTQEVAYNSVLMERRQQLHERVGAALESIYAESLDDHVAELAHQYARGGNPDKAVEYCQRAMWRFQYLGSTAEALAQFESGLELLQKLPDDNHRAELELDLRNSALGTVGDSRGVASPEVEQSYVRAMELSQRPGINWEKAWWALYGVLFVHLTRPDLRKASEIAGELVARAEEHGSAELVADAETYLACARMYSGDFELAAQGFERGWSLLESIVKPATDLAQWRRARTISRLLGSRQNNRALSAWNLWFLGYPDRALERMSTATTIAHSRSKSMLADIHGYAAYLCELRREAEPMKVWAEARLVLATESGYPVGRALSEIYLGWADALAGDLDGGIVRMRHHLSELRATGFAAGASYHLALIATAVAKMARFDEGLRTIDESFPIVERTGQRQHEAEVHRLRGELLLAQDSSNAAHSEKSFRTAIEIARKQGAKSWELRATTSLARLLAKQGRRDEARAMLAEIYGWFTEGFDTADLKDAEALLDELE